MAVLSYKYRIEPTRAQATAFGDMLADFCQLYNAGREQRIGLPPAPHFGQLPDAGRRAQGRALVLARSGPWVAKRAGCRLA